MCVCVRTRANVYVDKSWRICFERSCRWHFICICLQPVWGRSVDRSMRFGREGVTASASGLGASSYRQSCFLLNLSCAPLKVTLRGGSDVCRSEWAGWLGIDWQRLSLGKHLRAASFVEVGVCQRFSSELRSLCVCVSDQPRFCADFEHSRTVIASIVGLIQHACFVIHFRVVRLTPCV